MTVCYNYSEQQYLASSVGREDEVGYVVKHPETGQFKFSLIATCLRKENNKDNEEKFTCRDLPIFQWVFGTTPEVDEILKQNYQEEVKRW
jgi:hypothetical protein